MITCELYQTILLLLLQVQKDDLDAKGRPHVSDMELTLSRFSNEFEVKPHQDTLIHYSHW